MAKSPQTDKTIEKIGKVTIVTRCTTSNLWVRYPMTQDGKTKLIRKSIFTSDIQTARTFARKIDRDLIESKGIPLPAIITKPVSLKDAALSHPSSRRDKETYPTQYRLYCSYLDQFSRSTGAWLLKSLSVESALSWVEELKAKGFKPATISHRLRYIRRASKMAPSNFLPDVLAGIQLNRNHEPEEDIRIYSEEDLCKIVQHFETRQDWRALCAVGIMGLMGLRPTEVIRLEVGDVKDRVLRVGVRQRKNRASRRDLPMPETLQGWIASLSEGRNKTDPLVYSGHHGMKGKPWYITSLNHYLHPHINEATGTWLPAKHLRKTFASNAVGPIGLNVRTVETFLGHAFSLASPVSTRHYLAKQAVKELEPATKMIDQWWSNLYQTFTRGSGDSLDGGTPTRAVSAEDWT